MSRHLPKSARHLAVDILNRIDREGAFAEPLLDAVLSKGILEHPEDRHLLTQIVYGTLRMRGTLDWVIGQFRPGGVATLQTALRNILRTALYQLSFMDRLPDYAIVDEAVRITKKLTPAGAGLVNAILREVQRRGVAWPDPASEADPPSAIVILHSHPLWLVRRWWSVLGPEETVALCRANNDVPPLTVRTNTLKMDRKAVLADLEREGLSARPTTYSPHGMIIEPPGRPLRDQPAWRMGLLDIQDEASQLIPLLVDPRPGEKILDVCAGTGGKACHLAALMNNRGWVLAMDHHDRKIRELQGRARRLGAAIIEGRVADALRPQDDSLNGLFDRVLLDAPCSGLGTIRRKPEIRWRMKEEDLPGMARLQKDLLRSAAVFVRPGGFLVYSVCSVMPEENEAVVQGFLSSRREFSCIGLPDMIRGDFPEGGRFFKAMPHRHGMDGFFAAVLKRS